MTGKRVPYSDLQTFIARAFEACGMPADDAARAGSLMAEADLIGADGHGVFRLPQYVERIQAGGMNTKPEMNVVRERTAMALLDGDNGLGHLVMSRAAEIAMEKAATTGVAWVGAFNSNHAGPASLYACMPLKRDMIGLYVAVGSSNHLPPWGGTELLLSTNPIAVAIPSAERPAIVLDMATTVAAYGKVKTKLLRGELMPEGWMIDRMGNPLTDPKRASEGFLLPIGGPKGYGLSLVFGILAGTLNGAAFGRNVVDFNADKTSVTNTGQFVIALDVAAFTDVDDFKHEIDDIWAQMKSSDKLPGFDEIRLPGERLARTRDDYTANGIPIPEGLATRLDDVAASLGVAAL
ncbi:MAG TPA: Ldh family oxidoreductase [Afifellaceae bacterium]|nr:Ldh family oxidoreductase [Afifellaceae bacterium]